MRRTWSTAAALSLLSILTLAAPRAARAQAGSPGEFPIPGTDSTLKIYGYVQLHATVDFAGRPSGYENSDWATFLPAVPADDSAAGKRVKPQTYLTARTSRFGIQTRTPSKLGEVGVKLEADFNGPNGYQSENFTNSTVFRVRHAYVTVGDLLVGQTWSNFLDLGAAPDTVDFDGPGTLTQVRNPQIRYTFGLADALRLAVSAENTRGAQYGVDARFQTIPDLHANLGYAGGWGTLSARTVVQLFNRARLSADGSAYADEAAKSKVGVAGALSGSVKVGGDTLVVQVAGGPGIGRYLFNSAAVGNSGPGVTVEPDGTIDLWSVYGAHAGYTHRWSDQLRSNLVGAYTWVVDPEIGGAKADDGVKRTFLQGFVNTFYAPTKTLEVGLEYEFGQWRSFTNGTPLQRGTQHRLSASFHANFF